MKEEPRKKLIKEDSVLIQSKDTNFLLLSIKDLNQISSLLSSFYLKTDSLYKKSIQLLNSFHGILKLFHEETSDKQSANTRRSSLFLSEYANMNYLNNTCSNDLITVETLKQDNKNIISQLKKYTQLNNELINEFNNSNTNDTNCNGNGTNDLKANQVKETNNLIEVIKHIAHSNKKIKEYLQLNPSMNNATQTEKVIRLVEKINDLKEKNEILTLELFKKHPQEKLQLVNKSVIRKEETTNTNTNKVNETTKISTQIDMLIEENAKLNEHIESINKEINSYIQDIDVLCTDINDTIHFSNTQLNNLSEQYDSDMKWLHNALSINQMKQKELDKTMQLELVSKEIDISIYSKQYTVFNDISTQLDNIIKGKYSMLLLSSSFTHQRSNDITIDKYPTIREINKQLDSISLLVSHQTKKISSQSKMISDLSYENSLNHSNQYNSHISVSYTNRQQSHIKTDLSSSKDKDKEAKVSLLFNQFNDLHKDNDTDMEKDRDIYKDKGVSERRRVRPDIKERSHRHNSVSSLKTSNIDYYDSSIDLFKETERKIQDKIKEFKGKKLNNSCIGNEVVMNITKSNCNNSNSNTNNDKKYNSNAETKHDTHDNKSTNNNNNYITINDLQDNNLLSSMRNKKNNQSNRYNNNTNYISNRSSHIQIDNPNQNQSQIVPKSKRLFKCSSMKSIKTKDTSNSNLKTTSVYTAYQLSKNTPSQYQCE